MDSLHCIELETIDGVAVVRFKDSRVMDPARIELMGRELFHLVPDQQPNKILVNFENVKFFSSAAINKLIVFDQRVKAAGGNLRLSNLKPEVRDLFSYTKLDSIFKIDEEQRDSLESFDAD